MYMGAVVRRSVFYVDHTLTILVSLLFTVRVRARAMVRVSVMATLSCWGPLAMAGMNHC